MKIIRENKTLSPLNDLSQNSTASNAVDENSSGFKSLAKDLIENNVRQFSFLTSSREEAVYRRKIERIYSRNEIREMVTSNLIPEYQHEQIIDAVTDYLYGIHVDG